MFRQESFVLVWFIEITPSDRFRVHSHGETITIPIRHSFRFRCRKIMLICCPRVHKRAIEFQSKHIPTGMQVARLGFRAIADEHYIALRSRPECQVARLAYKRLPLSVSGMQ
jgi:hypothetical protein